jgi:alpha-tubulin suppressor-like RCC1 family protein
VAASISIFGLLSAGEVASDTSVTVSAGYTTGGITRNAQKSVTVINTTTSIISLNGDLVFGNVVTNTTATRTLTITNSGNSALNVSSMSYPSGFSGAWSGVIAAGGSTNVTVTFAPTALTTYSGTVAVNSDATSGLSTIAASGRGVVAPTRIISLSGDLAFGNVVVGQTATRTLTIASSGNLALNVSSISYPSGFSGAWSGSIAANGSHNVTVTFAPTAVTNYNGTVTVNSDMTSGVSTITASGTGTVALPGSVVAWGDNTYGQCNVPRGLTNVVASGFHHSLALKADGTVVGWGENDFGQTNPPAGLSNVAAIAAGWGTSLALKRDGTLEEWGWDGGYGLTTTAESLTNIKAIAACWDCFMALRNDNTVFVWGKSTHGETNVPAALNGVTAIAGGGWFCMALKGDGTVVTWGSNQFGQTNTPANLSGVKAIAAGGDHCLALQSDGTVVAWGYNYYGQTDVPPDLTDALSVSAGAYHSLALRADGTLVAWGLGSSGQTNIPTGLHGVTAISAGGFHNLALVAGSYPMQLSGVNCLPGGQVQFAVSGLAGDVYRVLGSTNLRDWQTIAWVTNLSGTMQFTDPGATGYNRRFYRLVMP